MYPAIKASTVRVRWQLREVHKVTQWKDGCVYRTRSLGIISCTPEYAAALRSHDIMVGSVSTRVMKLVGG
jgi:hypothetical protein